MLFVIFSLFLLKYFTFDFNFCQFDYYVPWCIPPWVYAAWDSLQLHDMDDYFFSHVGEVLSYYLFKYFLGPLLSSL